MRNSFVLLIAIAFIANTLCAVGVCEAATGRKLAELQRKLEAEPLAAHDIQMSELGGSITLEGTVSSNRDSQRIETLARSVDGVRSVKNNLRVVAQVTSLAGKIMDSLRRNPSVGSYRVKVRESRGIVTLSGRVASREDAQSVERLARNFPEVKDVRNELVVPPPVPNEELERRVRSRLMVRSARHLETVSFFARDGVVTFRGYVNRHHDIDEMLSEALMVSGVLDVKSEVSIGKGGTSQEEYEPVLNY